MALHEHRIYINGYYVEFEFDYDKHYGMSLRYWKASKDNKEYYIPSVDDSEEIEKELKELLDDEWCYNAQYYEDREEESDADFEVDCDRDNCLMGEE